MLFEDILSDVWGANCSTSIKFSNSRLYFAPLSSISFKDQTSWLKDSPNNRDDTKIVQIRALVEKVLKFILFIISKKIKVF